MDRSGDDKGHTEQVGAGRRVKIRIGGGAHFEAVGGGSGGGSSLKTRHAFRIVDAAGVAWEIDAGSAHAYDAWEAAIRPMLADDWESVKMSTKAEGGAAPADDDGPPLPPPPVDGMTVRGGRRPPPPVSPPPTGWKPPPPGRRMSNLRCAVHVQ